MAAPNRIECPLCQASIKTPLLPPGAACTCPRCGGAFRLAGGAEVPQNSLASESQSPAAGKKLPTGPTRQPASEPTEDTYPEQVAPEDRESELQDVPLACRLCGSRYYAPRAKIGKQVACPDCHTANLVTPPAKKPKQAAPRITGDEYEFKDEPLPPRPSNLLTPPAVDVALAPPVQRPPGEVNKDLAAAMLSKAAAELNEQPNTPGDINEEMTPFFQGSLAIFHQPQALALCVMCGIGLSLLMYDWRYVRIGLSAAMAVENFGRQLFTLLAIAAGAVGLPIVLAPLAAAFQAIVQETADGQKEVQSWPTLSFFDWIGDSMLTLAAFATGVLPGGLCMWALWTMDLPSLIIPGIGIASLWILFPIVFLSMSEANSLMAVATPAVLKSFHRSGEQWFLFYFATLLLAFGAFTCATIVLEGDAWTVFPASLALVAEALLYGRWLGRLANFIARDEAAAEEKAARLQKFLIPPGS